MQWLHRSAPLYQRGARSECSRNPRLAGHLALRDQLVTLHAMAIAIPALQRSHPLKARTAPIRDRTATYRRRAERYFDSGPKSGRTIEGRDRVSTTVPHPPHVSEESKPLRRVVALVIASAVRVDPKWFWENVPTD